MNLVKEWNWDFKAASDVKIYIKLSAIKPIHASWIVAAFQQVTKETLIRGWEKTCIKECVNNCRLWLPQLSVSHLQYDFTLWRTLILTFYFYYWHSVYNCNYDSIFCNFVIIYTPQTKFGGVYRNHPVRHVRPCSL